MGLDDLIRIVAILFFFVIPIIRGIVNGGKKMRGGQPPKPPRTGIPRQPQQTRGRPVNPQQPLSQQQRRENEAEDTRTDTRSAERPVASQTQLLGREGRVAPQPQQPQTRTGTSGGEGGAFGQRLEEARRRVREAVEAQTTTARTAPNTPLPAQPQTATLPKNDMFGSASVATQATVAPGTSAYEGRIPGAFLPAAAHTAMRSLSADLPAESAPLQVQRRRAKKYAKLDASPLVKLDEPSIMSGFIWHQILSEPRAKQRRRTRSQRQ